MNAKSLQERLIKWFEIYGRHELPWRNTNNIYHIYLSEIMLQQTQVNRVKEEYYPNFIDKFPTLEDLANANEEEVIAQWSGLGYYSRARNLYKTANLTYTKFPDTYNELIKLPGIGKYTASAICSFGYHQNTIVVDTNIARVLRRFFALNDANEKQVDEKAKLLANENASKDYNLALMDLGSFICTPKNPKCEQCPFFNDCLGKDEPEMYTKIKKTRYEKLDLYFGIVIKDDKIALVKSDTNMYKNMLVLPEVEPIEEMYILSFKHAYTKYNITVHLYSYDDLDYCDLKWFKLDTINDLPVASLTTKAINKLISLKKM